MCAHERKKKLAIGNGKLLMVELRIGVREPYKISLIDNTFDEVFVNRCEIRSL